MEEKPESLIRKIFPGIVISIVVIAILAAVVDPQILLQTFRNVSLELVLMFFLLQTAAFFFRGMAWRMALDKKPSVMQSYWTITEGYLLNLLPFRLGEIGRSVIMGRLVNESPVRVFSTVMLERLFDVLITLIILFLTIPLVSQVNLSTGVYLILGGILVAGLIVLYLIVRNQPQFIGYMKKFIPEEGKPGRFLYPQLNALFSGFQILNKPGKFLFWLFWILMTWVCWLLSVNVAMRAFFPELPGWASLFIQSITALGGAIPAAPAGIGVIEGAFVAALAIFGIDQSRSLGFGMFVHTLGIITPVIYGIIGFIIQGQSFSEVFARLKHTDLSQKEDVE